MLKVKNHGSAPCFICGGQSNTADVAITDGKKTIFSGVLCEKDAWAKSVEIEKNGKDDAKQSKPAPVKAGNE